MTGALYHKLTLYLSTSLLQHHQVFVLPPMSLNSEAPMNMMRKISNPRTSRGQDMASIKTSISSKINMRRPTVVSKTTLHKILRLRHRQTLPLALTTFSMMPTLSERYCWAHRATWHMLVSNNLLTHHCPRHLHLTLVNSSSILPTRRWLCLLQLSLLVRSCLQLLGLTGLPNSLNKIAHRQKRRL